MMYNQKLVASIKANGKILREFKDTVYIPFGSEYSILIKNLHTTRAIINVFIDGDSMVSGGLVVEPGREIELERSIKNGNLNEGNKFKFIERTGSIESHRGIKLEDGLVRIEFQYEQQKPVVYATDPTWSLGLIYRDNVATCDIARDMQPRGIRGYTYSAELGNANVIMGTCDKSFNAQTTNSITLDCAINHNDVGITVAGSKSNQKFYTTSVNALESVKHSIILKILGVTSDNETVSSPITIKYKLKCITCGKQNKVTAKFCTECGTALEIFV